MQGMKQQRGGFEMVTGKHRSTCTLHSPNFNCAITCAIPKHSKCPGSRARSVLRSCSAACGSGRWWSFGVPPWRACLAALPCAGQPGEPRGVPSRAPPPSSAGPAAAAAGTSGAATGRTGTLREAAGLRASWPRPTEKRKKLTKGRGGDRDGFGYREASSSRRTSVRYTRSQAPSSALRTGAI